jgi:hypothetical protein
MVHRGDLTSMVRAVAVATKWGHPVRSGRKGVATPALKVAAATMARVAIVKKAADICDRKAHHVAKTRMVMPRKVPDTCVVKDHPAAMARPETATKAPAVDVQTARHVAMDHLKKMALVVSTILTETDHPIRPAQARIRKRATTSPTPLCNSLVSTRGARILVPANTLPGLLHSSCRRGAIVPIDRSLPADFHPDVEVLGQFLGFRPVPATFVAARNRPIYTEIRHFRAQSPPAAYSAGLIHASIGNDSLRDCPQSSS